MSLGGFTSVLGILALLTGFGDMFGLDLPTLAILLIILGLNLILKPWFEERGIFRKPT